MPTRSLSKSQSKRKSKKRSISSRRRSSHKSSRRSHIRSSRRSSRRSHLRSPRRSSHRSLSLQLKRSCPPGQIKRISYIRVTHNGKSKTRISSSCIRDRGLLGKGPYILPIPKKGVLSQFGYEDVAQMTMRERRKALKKAIKKEGPLSVIKHLTLVANYNKRTNPVAHKIFKKDQQWISKERKRNSRLSLLDQI